MPWPVHAAAGDFVVMQVKDVTGYWIGEATGTNKGGLALTLQQNGTRITGTGKFSEPSLGVCACSVAGEAHDGVTLILSPLATPGATDFGHVRILAQLQGEEEMSGKWQTDIGAEGILTMKRVDPSEMSTSLPRSNSVFLVHGHDEGTQQAVARFLEKLGVKPVILHEQINRGMTLIEKFEDFAARAGFAVILITPDDDGYPSGRQEEKRQRARQNVIFELGFFGAKLGRKRTMVLTKGTVELPSDVLGLVYEPMDRGHEWKWRLASELKAAGFDVDLNKAIA